MAGTYVKTVGRKGEGRLFVTDWMGNEQKIEFVINIQDLLRA